MKKKIDDVHLDPILTMLLTETEQYIPIKKSTCIKQNKPLASMSSD